MSGIGSVAPAAARIPVEQQQLDPDRGKPPRRPSDDDTVTVEPHSLDLEA
jgi:hypothetical protein